MSGFSTSNKRGRVYKRKFDWEDARRRHSEGATFAQLADLYGVSKDAVRRVCLMEAMPVRSEEFVPSLYRCPLCGGPRSRRAQLCKACWSLTVLPAMSVRRTPGRKRVPLASVRLGSIVRCRGNWGVVEHSGRNLSRRIHFWDGSPIFVPTSELVEVAPSLRVYVDGQEERAETIA